MRNRRRVAPSRAKETSAQKAMLEGPVSFELEVGKSSYAVLNSSGTFLGSSARAGPKLYVVVSNGSPIYVGVTRQSLARRFRLGWKADGSSGYYGYAFRHKMTRATVDVWTLSRHYGTDRRATLAIETIEAEVVFLLRKRSGQWPQYQTEIHFHASDTRHREAASAVLSRYRVRRRSE